MNALGIPGVRISAEEKQTCGIRASHVRIVIDGEEEGLHHHHVHEHEHHHHHSGLAEIRSPDQRSGAFRTGEKRCSGSL